MGQSALVLLLCWAMAGAAQQPGASPSSDPSDVASVAAPASVVAKIQGVRQMEAVIDSLTDGNNLRLRVQRAGITLWRRVAWEDVQWVQIGNQRLSGQQLQQLVDRLCAERPHAKAAQGQTNRNQTIVIRGRPEPLDGSRQSAVPLSPPDRPAQRRGPSRVRYLAVDAAVTNWDADPETDGLLVQIQPTDQYGDTLAVTGLLEVELMARKTGVSPPPQPFARIGYWSQAVRVEDFGPNGAVYRLPFEQVHPEFQREYAVQAAVLARLSVPSMGVFAATADWVRIRPFSPVRDKLQQLTGQRFFPDEYTADGRR